MPGCNFPSSNHREAPWHCKAVKHVYNIHSVEASREQRNREMSSKGWADDNKTCNSSSWTRRPSLVPVLKWSPPTFTQLSNHPAQNFQSLHKFLPVLNASPNIYIMHKWHNCPSHAYAPVYLPTWDTAGWSDQALMRRVLQHTDTRLCLHKQTYADVHQI